MTTEAAYNENIKKLRELINGIHIAMLTTADEAGNLRSRPMGTQEVDFDGDLYFFTGNDSQKVHEINVDRHVNVAYSSPDHNRYVSVTGIATLLHDKRKMEELWSPAYKLWFEKGLDDPNLGLLKVRVDSVEYWESPSSPVVKLVGFVKALTGGGHEDLGKNETLSLKK